MAALPQVETERDRLVRAIGTRLGDIETVAWSPDGTRVAAAGDRGVAVFTTAGRRVWSRNGDMWGMAWAPDGKTLATGQSGGPIPLLSTESGQKLHELRGH